MGADTDGVSFPVIFSECERESEMGNIFIDASLSFKSFQSMLSRRIGVSPHQISIYLVDRTRSQSPPRKIPITGKVDFSDFLHEKDCAVFTVLKRSRRERRRGAKKDSAGREVRTDRSKKISSVNVILLRRSAAVGCDRRFSVLLPLVEYEFSDLRLGGEDTANRRVAVRSGGSVVCEECLGRDGGFHWCVYDTVTAGFRSSRIQLEAELSLPIFCPT